MVPFTPGGTADVMARLQRDYDAGYPETQGGFTWWIGDNYAGNNRNNYVLFESGALKLLLLQLEVNPPTAVVAPVATTSPSARPRTTTVPAQAMLRRSASSTPSANRMPCVRCWRRQVCATSNNTAMSQV